MFKQVDAHNIRGRQVHQIPVVHMVQVAHVKLKHLLPLGFNLKSLNEYQQADKSFLVELALDQLLHLVKT